MAKCVNVQILYMKKGEKKNLLLSYFFVKKYLLVGVSGMLWIGGSVSGSVRDVCMSHQSDWLYY